MREHFQNALKDSGLCGQDFTLHSLRHTFTTRCAENNIAIKVTQKWVGHSTTEMTQNVYTHVNEDFEKEEIAKLSDKSKRLIVPVDVGQPRQKATYDQNEISCVEKI